MKQKECAVVPLPKIMLSAADYPRLEQIARLAAQKGDLDAIFLTGEINRAEIVPDACDDDLSSVVTMGSWVTYCTNWGVPRRTVQLVWPEACWNADSISVLTPLGAALIGLRVGDQMPYFVAGCLNVVRVQSITQSRSNVVPFSRRHRQSKPFDDDPGPTAA
ncbi:GreA/GreB family elongation factor [Bradyrhizobium sp. DOA1]|uniref:GreA/GreB family elongation factor n=1 Tax=Bradyrhizobium sp. DOA1 TaxID=1126616 RepID=UPI00077CCAF8|nr:GreA/GreB family elongation factor [Bradyrhizobium sp. DOA1]KYH01906.1 hypothetical protein SE91_28705 [Bradyrhizobium sp. DOA1]